MRANDELKNSHRYMTSNLFPGHGGIAGQPRPHRRQLVWYGVPVRVGGRGAGRFRLSCRGSCVSNRVPGPPLPRGSTKSYRYDSTPLHSTPLHPLHSTFPPR